MWERQTDIPYFSYPYQHLGTITIIVAAISGLSHVLYYAYKGMTPTLPALIAKIAAGGALPGSTAMLGAAIYPKGLLACVNDIGLYVLVGSVSIVWITLTVLFPKSIEAPSDKK